MQHVGGGDEKYLRQVVFHVEVMIAEAVILLRIQNFQQRRRGIAAEIHGHFVHFIEHDHWILGAGLLHHLDDLAGQRADVSAAMAPDLGFVAHSAQRHADKFPSRGLGDGHAQRGFANSRGANETQDRAFGIFHQLPHRQKFQDAFLDLFQAVVVVIQRVLGASDVADLFRALLPRHCQQPVQVVARDGGLGRHRRHGFKLFELLHRLFVHLFGHAGGVNLFLQLIELALLAAPQLFLNGLDLLVEVVLFLRLFHLPLHPRLDGAVHVQLFDLDIEHVGDAIEPLDGIENLQQLLFFFDGELQVGGDGVGEPRRIVNLDGGDHGLVIQ